MKIKKINPTKNIILDEFEQEIEDSIGRGEFVSTPNFEETKKMFQEAAKNFRELRETKSITLRVKQGDLIKVKAKAIRNKLPYQTLIGILIHKYAEGETKITL